MRYQNQDQQRIIQGIENSQGIGILQLSLSFNEVVCLQMRKCRDIVQDKPNNESPHMLISGIMANDVQ